MKLRPILLLASLTLAGVAQAQTIYTVTGTNINTYDGSNPSSLFATAPITGLNAGDVIIGLDRRPANGSLVALTNNAGVGRLYTISASSGQASLLSTLAADPADATLPYTGLSGTSFGVDFNPVPDRLRVTSDAAQNLRINVDTGAVTTDGALNGATTSIQASGYTNAFAGATTTSLFGINGSTDILYNQVPPNDGTQVAIGPLGVDTGNVIGLDVLTDNGTATNMAFAALSVAGVTNLATVSLTSGAASLIGVLGAGAPIQGFTVQAGAPGGNGASGVPAFGTGGMVLLGLLFAALALVVIRQSR